MHVENSQLESDRLAFAEELARQVNERLAGKEGFRKIIADDILSAKKEWEVGAMQLLMKALRLLLKNLLDFLTQDYEKVPQKGRETGSTQIGEERGHENVGVIDRKNIIQRRNKNTVEQVAGAVNSAVAAFENSTKGDLLGEAAQRYIEARERFSLADTPAPSEIVADYLRASSQLVDQLESQYSSGLDKILARYRSEPQLLEAVESARRALVESQRERVVQFSADAKFGPVPPVEVSRQIDKPVFARDVEGLFGSEEPANNEHQRPDLQQR